MGEIFQWPLMRPFTQAEILCAATHSLPMGHPDDELFDVQLQALPPRGNDSSDVIDSFHDAIAFGNPHVGSYRVINYAKNFPDPDFAFVDTDDEESTDDEEPPTSNTVTRFCIGHNECSISSEEKLVACAKVVLADRAPPTSERASAPTAGEETIVNPKTVRKTQKLADRLKRVNVELATFKSQCEATANRMRQGPAEKTTNLKEGSDLSDDSDSNSLDEVEGSQLGADDQSIDLNAPD